ncbi:hypothetical protein QJS04_geneDACA023080 [Acorus gramineus]|uniref:Uncharacterized protein n=1 Tax=Acorus gramineus TaxID=55184 RepID=A0AAV9BKH2_ACOGR|nr:hypothetical protein QJS04_geneDACA023080 [Acorus gramineus]
MRSINPYQIYKSISNLQTHIRPTNSYEIYKLNPQKKITKNPMPKSSSPEGCTKQRQRQD